MTYWVADYWQQMKNLDSVSLHVFYLISNLFIYINHACNFFFYVMLNKPFRNLLWRKLSLRSAAKGGDSQGAPNTNSFTLRGESMKLKRVSSSATVPTCRSRLLGGDNYTSKSDCEKPFTNWNKYIVQCKTASRTDLNTGLFSQKLAVIWLELRRLPSACPRQSCFDTAWLYILHRTLVWDWIFYMYTQLCLT